MSEVTLDAELRSKLGDLSRVTALRDETGKVVAQVIPMTSRYWVPPFTQEELDRQIEENTEWFTSEQVFEMLRKLEEGQ